jgi:hypothetical protein
MAFASSSSVQPIVTSFATFLPVSEKLTCSNYILWKAQVHSALKGAQLANSSSQQRSPPNAFLAPKEDDKESATPNPEYATWVAKDQTVLNYLLSNLSKEILAQVSTEVTAAGASVAITGMFAS